MKKLFSLLLICSISVSVFSQDLKSNNNQITKFENLRTDNMFYQLFDTCEENKKTEGCWKLGLNFNKEEADYSRVSSSKMHFYYVPKSSLGCNNVVFYELSPNANYLGWSFKNQNISISIKMQPDESAFSYHLSEIRITNLKGESCFGPKSVLKKLY
jgi:hypothetical protein